MGNDFIDAAKFMLVFVVLSVVVFMIVVFMIFFFKDNYERAVEDMKSTQQRLWIEQNIEENYTVSSVDVELSHGIIERENSTREFFTIEGFSDDVHDRVSTKGYLNFDAQVVVISNEADGVFVPVEGSDAERILEGSNAE